jgi:dipeptidyl aminopeptidase/acylaminoacyl peptidase
MFTPKCFLLVAIFVLMITFGAVAQHTAGNVASLLGKGEYIPDIATFLQIGGANPSGISWDGDGIFFRTSMSGVSQVYRLTAEGWPYQLSTFEDGVDFFNLSYDGKLAIVGASIGGSEQSQLYLMDTHTGRTLQLTSFEDIQFGSVAWSRDDKSIFYRSNEENGTDFFLYMMNINSGAAQKIFGDTTGGVTGYNAIFDLSQDGTKMIVGNFTSNVNNDLYLLDIPTGDYQKLNDDNIDVYYGAVTLMPGNETLWLTCNNNDDGIQRLAKMTVGSSKLEWVDDGWIDPAWEIDAFGFSRDYKTMFAEVNVDGYVRAQFRNAETMEELPSPPLDGIISVGGSDKNGNVYFSFNGPTLAPDVWRWNPATEELTQLTFSIYAGIDREIFQQPTLIHYKSFDDLEIPAFLYLPPDYVEGTEIPFIVHAHGGPESQYQPYFLRNVQYLLLNGYGILAPNPRGSSGYGREYLNLDNYKNRKHSLRDYKAGVDFLIENGYTKKGMIGIRGGSYGGYVVLGMITEYPDLFSAAIDIVGISNFKTFLENTRAYRRALRESEYGPLSDPEFLESISPIHKADQIITPLLVIHGVNDPRVPIGEARQIIAAVQANGGAVDSLIFANEGHGSGRRSNTIKEYRKQVEFFDRHLKVFDTKKEQ